MDNTVEGAVLRCRRCRKSFLDTTCLHPMKANDGAASAGMCTVWHITVETLPEWILKSVHQSQWTVGKLICEKCGARLGGFNFRKNAKCPCGQESIMHLSKSRVDQDHGRSIHVVTGPKIRGRGGPCSLEAEPGGAGQVCEQDKSEGGLIGSTISFMPRLNTASRRVRTSLATHSQSDDISANQSGLFSATCIVSHRASVARGRLEPSSSLVDENKGGTEHMSHTPPPAAPTGRSPTCPSPRIREGSTLISSEQREHSGETVQLGDLPPGLTPLTVRRTDVSVMSEEEVHEEGSWGTQREPQARPVVPEGLSKREKNRLKSQRRKQRKKERWIYSQEQTLTATLTEEEEDKEAYTCSVCLDVYFSPYSCQPCGHIFCEPCLRTLAKNRTTNTPCPLCRTLISQTLFEKELNQTAEALFPKVYRSRKHNFQNAKCAKWPLPNCQKHLRVFWGYQRQAASRWRWHFPPAGFTLDALDLSDMRAWLFDIDLIIMYIQSVNWILTLLVLCFLAYVFFS
ncbi:hypothetical protein DPEC_G00324120 [Dallia pectoralis]|uniref:Uncharacterized protein n=1 Tax=Dallia pectoralis TaxID=75939 RepID=A0ACC2FAU5_DALPE|nr:hypothetical protein DPEC_G00324120 [Dallia pectoralis]